MIVRYTGPQRLRANQRFSATLEIELQESISPGGRVALAMRHVSDFGDAQCNDPGAENYVAWEVERPGVRFDLDARTPWYRHPWNRGFDLVLAEGCLGPGDCLRLQLGGAAGYRAQSFVEERSVLRVGVLPEPEGQWVVSQLDRSPQIEIVGAGVAQLRLRVPDVNAQAPSGSVCLKLEDAYGNPCAPEGSEAPELALLWGDRCLARRRLAQGMAEWQDVPLPADGDWQRLTAASDDGRLYAVSNPLGPSLMAGYRLYWGEIHSQSGLCDGTNSPAYLYRYGRQAAGLDFAAVTSHDMELTPEAWQEIQRATREAHQPRRYVTFLGYEWSGPTPAGGDNNVYYLADEGPLLYNGPCFSRAEWNPANDWITGQRTIADVAREVGALPTLIVPHCGGRIANLDYYDARTMPVFELHSCHRNYEDVAHEAIRRGLHLGFIGGSDDHRGALGDSVPTARERFFSSRNGLAAVYARDLTRESLWEAIFARRVYATNGCRPALSFVCNDVPMGGELRARVGELLHLAFEVVMDGFFDHAELVRGTETVARYSRNQNQILRYSECYEEAARPGDTAYWLRVYQTDGGVAWSSPIWVAGER